MGTPYRFFGDQYENKRSKWYFNAIFHMGINGTGSRVTIHLPWALFPMMRCGDHYQAGQKIPKSSLGKQEFLDFTGLGKPTLERMNHDLPPQFRDLLIHTTFNEFMFVWRDGNRRIILPVLEMLRAVFLKNDTLAKGILDPIFLHSIAQWSVSERVLRIQFRESFPLPTKRSDRNAVLRLLAYLYCESTFLASFKSVGQNRVLNPKSALETTFPSLNPNVVCQTYSDDAITFIWHIEHVAVEKTLDIQAVHFTHPKHRRRFMLRPEKPPGGNVYPGGDSVLDIGSPAVKPGWRPKPIKSLLDTFFDDLRLKVKNVAPQEPAKPRVIFTPEYDQQDQDLSLGARERGGTHRGAYIEITPGDSPVGDERLASIPNWQQNRNDGFDAFREMVKELQKMIPNCVITWFRGPQIIPGRVKPIMRPYMIVHLQAAPMLNDWLLEFRQSKRNFISTAAQPSENLPALPNTPKNQGMSTMILTGIPMDVVMDEVTEVIQDVLVTGLQSGYHWDNEKLERLEILRSIQIHSR